MSDVNGAEASNEVAVVEERLPVRDKHRARDIKVGRQGITFENAADQMAFARMMADSRIAVPKHLRDNVGACLAVVDYASRFGMSPYALATESYLVNDQIAYMAKAIAAIIIAHAPISKRPRFSYAGEGADRRCTVTMFPIDDDPIEHQSPRVGDIKVKNSPLWVADPDQQLAYYTMRAACRRYFPDTIMGLYDVEELGQRYIENERAEPDIQPPPVSGLAGRLPGPAKTGYNAAHVDSEINGDAEKAAVVEPVGEEAAFIEELGDLLKTAKTALEVGAVAAQASSTMAALSDDVRGICQQMVDDRLETVTKGKGKAKR
jgi:hypothetical protein